ncbi:MAG: sulfotransferase [Bacteroidetes bacterium]|nr:sulfotransferase [Bacteroidota bacterium]
MDSRKPNMVPIFFIMGRPRSGTTLLSTLFDAHPNVKIPPEFPIMLPLYQEFRKVKDWDEEAINSFVAFIFQHNVFIHRTLENLKIDRAGFTADLMTLAHKGTIQDFLKKLNEQGFSLFPKQEILRIGDKNPVYSIYTERFLKIFPDARFICIIRDYRDNFVSMRKLSDLKLEAPILTLQVYRWRYVAKLFLKCKKRYPDRFRVIRYEDLVMNKSEVLADLCQFIGIPFDPAVFDFYKKKEETFRTYNNPLVERFHGSLMNPVNTGRMELWKKEMTPAEIRMADFVAGKYAGIFNYDRVEKSPSLILWLKSRPMAIYGFLIFKLYVWGSYLPSRISLWLSVKLLVLVRTWHYFSGKKK